MRFLKKIIIIALIVLAFAIVGRARAADQVLMEFQCSEESGYYTIINDHVTGVYYIDTPGNTFNFSSFGLDIRHRNENNTGQNLIFRVCHGPFDDTETNLVNQDCEGNAQFKIAEILLEIPEVQTGWYYWNFEPFAVRDRANNFISIECVDCFSSPNGAVELRSEPASFNSSEVASIYPSYAGFEFSTTTNIIFNGVKVAGGVQENEGDNFAVYAMLWEKDGGNYIPLATSTNSIWLDDPSWYVWDSLNNLYANAENYQLTFNFNNYEIEANEDYYISFIKTAVTTQQVRVVGYDYESAIPGGFKAVTNNGTVEDEIQAHGIIYFDPGAESMEMEVCRDDPYPDGYIRRVPDTLSDMDLSFRINYDPEFIGGVLTNYDWSLSEEEPDFATVASQLCFTGQECRLWFSFNRLALGADMYLHYYASTTAPGYEIASTTITASPLWQNYVIVPDQPEGEVLYNLLMVDPATENWYIETGITIKWVDEEYFEQFFDELPECSAACDDMATSSGAYVDDLLYGLECSLRKVLCFAFRPSKDAVKNFVNAAGELQRVPPFNLYFDLVNRAKSELDNAEIGGGSLDLPMIDGEGNYYMLEVVGTSTMAAAIGEDNTNLFRQSIGYMFWLLVAGSIFFIVF